MSGNVYFYKDGEPVAADDGENRLPTDARIIGAIQVGKTGDSEYVVIPGIGTGAAYTDGYAFGTTITFPNVLRPNVGSGVLYSATYLDLDDEGLQVDLHLFKRPPTYVPINNAAYSPSDSDLLASGYICTVSFTTFSNFGANQVSYVGNIGRAFANAAGTDLYGQCVARGVQNIAAANLPMMSLQALAD